MVSINDLGRAGDLSAELTNHQRAIAALGRRAPIQALTIVGVTVVVGDMPYPEQMGQAIGAALQTRADALRQQLEEMGVDVAPPPEESESPAAAAPAAEPAHERPSRRK